MLQIYNYAFVSYSTRKRILHDISPEIHSEKFPLLLADWVRIQQNFLCDLLYQNAVAFFLVI